MKRVLVTGNLGFIGSHFIRWLLSTEEDVRIIGLSRNSDQKNQQRIPIVSSWHRRFQQVYGDLTDRQSLSGICEDVDYVVNFAAKTFVDHSLKDPEPFIQSNIVGANNLMEDATRYNVKRFIQISTDEVYGQILEGAYTEDAKLNPRNPYAWSKACADLAVTWRYNTYQFPAIITRTENNFGPWQHRQKVLPVFTRKALAGECLPVYGDGQHVRCWLYVEDHCRAIWFLLEHGSPGEIYHVAGEQELKNLELAQFVLKTLGKPEDQIQFIEDHNVRPGHDRRYALDVHKLKSLGWEPKYDLEERLAHTINWYKDNLWWLQ
jgi:dTDP-glucose 4,6-dehydratase